MLKYSFAMISDTYDFIKKFIIVFDLIIQVVYIAYVISRIVSSTGFLILNIILITISCLYFLYNLFSYSEFYTSEEKTRKKNIKLIIRFSKRLVFLVIICMAIYQIIINPQIGNMTLLVTAIMIINFVFAILLDVIIILLDKKTNLIKNAFYLDVANYKKEHSFKSKLLNKFVLSNLDLDINTSFPPVEDAKTLDKIRKTHLRQNNKKQRRAHYFKKRSK